MSGAEKINRRITFFLLSFIVSILIAACTSTKESTSTGPLIIEEQGSFEVGGTIITRPGVFEPIGIRGNTHFPMSDLNNLEIADHLSEFLKKKGLD